MGDAIKHYGMPRRSGRYPWGSGQDPQRHISFRSVVKDMRSKGMSDVDIAKAHKMTTTELRAKLSLEKTEERNTRTAEAIRLKDKGYSTSEVGRRMGLNESSVRSLLDPVLAERAAVTKNVSGMLRDEVERKRFVDIGSGVETHIGVTQNKLRTSVEELKQEGYKVHKVNVPQVGMPGQFTIVKVLGAKDSTWVEVVREPTKIQTLDVYSDDLGRTFKPRVLDPPVSISSKRIKVNYAEDGGSLKDGVIEMRRGVKDLDLVKSQYAQVRILVDNTHFMKGMAIYSDSIPNGVDIVYNSNKPRGTPALGSKDNTVLKNIKDDPDNPFGSSIKYPDGRRGALNIVNEEGDWDKWSKTISSQVLSKQTDSLAKKQLDIALKQKRDEYDEIMTLTNPVVKKQLLSSFADDCDASSVHLKAASLPRQASKVILPIPKLKETEVYAPTFRDGESVVLIRHPHGGRFEIPQLTVNNKSAAARSIMKDAPDAIGIHPNVAKKLSGADFDGDSVIVIPNNQGHIRTAPSLKGLENFDPIEQYRIPAGSTIPPIKKQTKQQKMGEVSNLITDMTIKGANFNEVARAVRHSMVVIDSEKHNLDYRQSYVDHGISALSEKYQGKKGGGAATLVSRAGSQARVPERKPRSMKEGGPVDPRTGEKVFTKTGATYTRVKYRDPETGRIKETFPADAKRKGYTVISEKQIPKTIVSKQMLEQRDAHALSSGRSVENIYADYANSLKGMANKSRKDVLSIKNIPYSHSAKITYNKEVNDLVSKLNVALRNKPLERQAQILANSIVKRKKDASPDMDKDELKKVRNQALVEARTRTGAQRTLVHITDKEWEAIQAGAVSTSRLEKILQNTDLDRVKQLATPRKATTFSAARLSRARQMLSRGATKAEVAEALGVSVKTLNNALIGERS